MIFWKDFNLGAILFVYFFTLLFVTPAHAHSNQQQTPPTQKDNPQKTQVTLSEDEKVFLQDHPVIRLGTDHRWEPYVIKKSDGSLEGFDIDLLRIINDMTGANIQIVTGHWAEIVEQAKDREIDGLATSAANKEREPFFNFSAPYVQVFPAFVVKHDSTFNIQSIDSLSGKSVAILKGNQFHLSLLKNYPSINVIEAPSEAYAIKLTVEGKADASIVATTSYNTHYKVFSNLIRIGYIATDKPLKVVYSVRKDWPELKSILNKALAVIPQETYNELYYKWFNMEPVRQVQRDKEIRTIIVDNYFPYTFVNDKGEPDGFSVDLIKAVAKELGMNIKIRVDVWDNALKKLSKDEINVLPMMAYSEERDKKFDFSPPHTVAYDAYFTRKGSPKIRNSKDLKGKKIIVMKNDRAHDHLKSIPFITDDHLIFENNTAEALKKLSSGIGDTAVMPKVLGLVLLNKLKLENVDPSPTAVKNYQRSFSFAVNKGNSDLLVRLENGLQIIKETGEYKKLNDKWFSVYETHEVSFGEVLKYFLWIIIAFALVSSILILWTVALKRQVSHRTKELEQEIDERKQTEEALRESEEKYRNLVDNAIMGFYQVDKEGKFAVVNKRMAEIFGYSSTQELLSSVENITEFYVNPEERSKILEEINKKGFIERKEIEFKDKEKKHIWIILNTRGTTKDDGTILYEGMMEDITEQKEIKKDRNRLQAQLQQAQKMESIGTLAGGIAHDFNNILSPIMIHSEMVMMELPSGSPLKQNMKQIYKAGERARDLVMQILTFARKQEKERIPLKVSQILKEAIKLLRSSIPTTIDIQYNINSEQDTVLSDPTQLNQIIMNLCTNSSHAMEEKGGTLEVILNNENIDSDPADGFPDLEPGRYVKLTVTDTGQGIEPQFMDKIFEPYFTTKEVGKGTGMGLALVHGIVKSYGGAVTVQSEVGKGTSFHVYLPLVEDDTDILETAQDSVPLPTGTERILFVDDEKVAVDTMQLMLEKLGYKVTARTSSIEALEAFRHKAEAFDLVITDMAMPNMTGKDLAKELMVIRPDIPIILCTGFSEQIDENRAKEMGISAFIMKPIVMGQIANTIREVLDGK